LRPVRDKGTTNAVSLVLHKLLLVILLSLFITQYSTQISVLYMCTAVHLIIIIFINCKWLDTRWQWSIYILHMHGLWRLITLDSVGGGLHGKHVVATWKGKMGTIPAFALGPRKTKKNLCRDGRSQDLPVSDF
jgi:cadmium resistance protein CadD (predicted permease)